MHITYRTKTLFQQCRLDSAEVCLCVQAATLASSWHRSALTLKRDLSRGRRYNTNFQISSKTVNFPSPWTSHLRQNGFGHQEVLYHEPAPFLRRQSQRNRWLLQVHDVFLGQSCRRYGCELFCFSKQCSTILVALISKKWNENIIIISFS